MNDEQFVAGLAVGIFALSFVAALIRSGPRDDHPVIERVDFTGATRRRRDAKRFNEQAKLFSTFLNNLGIAVIVTVAIAPAIQQGATIAGPRTFMALVIASMLHISGHLVLRSWKSEE